MIFYDIPEVKPPYTGGAILLPETIPTSLLPNDDWEEYPIKTLVAAGAAAYHSFDIYGFEYEDAHPGYCSHYFRNSQFKNILTNKITSIIKV